MSQRVAVVWDDRLASYDFGPGHPLAPVRVQLAMQLAGALGVLDQPSVRVIGPVSPASDEDLLRVHGRDYLAAVRAASQDADYYDLAHGLGTSDNPVFAGMHDAAARVAGAAVLAADQLVGGGADHAVSLAGGLHHALPNAASGFCVYNDVAVAIARLLDAGVDRIAYVDVDVHHGDGVEAIFWDDPRVLTISIHEHPRSLFPGTGYPQDTGGPHAQGTAVNLPVPAGTSDQGWLRSLYAVVPDLLGAFGPEVIVSQQGVDTHAADPLAHLLVSVDGQRMAFDAIHRWAHEYAGGRWLAFGGGGYELVDVVPRAWTHLLAIASGHPIAPDTPLPKSFAADVQRRLRRTVPPTMSDGRQPRPRRDALDPEDAVDALILATQAAVFPFWGLAAPEW